MKRIITLFGFCLVGTILFAQQEADTSTFKYRGKVITITTDTTFSSKEKKSDVKTTTSNQKFEYWRGMEFGFTGYFMDDQFGYNNDPENIYMELDFGRSFVFNLNFAEFNKGLFSEQVRFTTGLGFRFNRYAFKNSTYTLSQNETEIFATKDSLRDYYTNFLNATYLTAPVYFTLVSGKDPSKSFHVSLGVIGSARLRSRTKQRFVENGKKEKEITRETFHLNPFTLDYSIRFGYGDFTAFANYSATQLFEKNKGPEYYPFSLGLSWNF
jgi:hypothetical protein